MNPELRKFLIKAFLLNKYPESFQDAWLSNRATYEPLVEALERISDWGPDFLNLSNLNDPPQFSALFTLLDKAVSFSTTEPPHCSYNEETLNDQMDKQVNFWSNLPKLPHCNYTIRPTNQSQISVVDKLKEEEIQSLVAIVKVQVPKLRQLSDLPILIEEHQILIEKELKEDRKKRLEHELELLKDLNKLAKLSTVAIPNEDGSLNYYCVLAESAGGVTEKLSLMKLEDVIEQLNNFQKFEGMNASFYLSNHNKFKLSTQAILKLPKHGDVIEVQREAIALNISRILGLSIRSN